MGKDLKGLDTFGRASIIFDENFLWLIVWFSALQAFSESGVRYKEKEQILTF